MDNINWVKLKDQETQNETPKGSMEEKEAEVPDEIEVYKQMVELMKPGEFD